MGAGTGSGRRANSRSWKPGQSGNPAGPKPGIKRQIEADFLRDMHRAWTEKGVEVIDRVIASNPDVYLRVMAQLLPRQTEMRVEPFDEIADDELATLLLAARSALDLTRSAGARGEATREPQQIASVQTLQ